MVAKADMERKDPAQIAYDVVSAGLNCGDIGSAPVAAARLIDEFFKAQGGRDLPPEDQQRLTLLNREYFDLYFQQYDDDTPEKLGEIAIAERAYRDLAEELTGIRPIEFDDIQAATGEGDVSEFRGHHVEAMRVLLGGGRIALKDLNLASPEASQDPGGREWFTREVHPIFRTIIERCQDAGIA